MKLLPIEKPQAVWVNDLDPDLNQVVLWQAEVREEALHPKELLIEDHGAGVVGIDPECLNDSLLNLRCSSIKELIILVKCEVGNAWLLRLPEPFLD
jgi:hypothetical protein